MLEVRGITKSFGGTTAVREVSFTAEDGRVTGFLGPNGAGKSTTMRILAGIDRPDAGECRIGGVNPMALGAPAHALGALLDGQGANPGLRAVQHLRSVAAPCGISRARVDEVLAMVGLAEVARRRAGKFSLGMKQRLGLAVALLGDPGHLILDEPVNGLDPDGVIWMRNLLRQLAAEGRCVLLSSHLMSELELCADDLVIIRDARVIRSGPLASIVHTDRSVVGVESTDNARLGAALERAGGDITEADGRLRVADLDGTAIGLIARDVGVALSLLAPERRGLESAYLDIVNEAETAA